MYVETSRSRDLFLPAPGYPFSLRSKTQTPEHLGGARDSAVARALSSHQCGPCSNPGVEAICGLNLLLVLSFAPRGFFSGYSGFPLSSKTNASKFQFDQESNQVDEEPLCGCATSKSLFIFFFSPPTVIFTQSARETNKKRISVPKLHALGGELI